MLCNVTVMKIMVLKTMIYKVLKRVPRKNKRYLSNIDEKKNCYFFFNGCYNYIYSLHCIAKVFSQFSQSSFLFSQSITKLKKKGGKNMKRGKDMASKKFCCKVMIIAI